MPAFQLVVGMMLLSVALLIATSAAHAVSISNER